MKQTTRAARNYIAKVSTRADVQEERAKHFESKVLHLELSLQAALAKIRSLEESLARAEAALGANDDTWIIDERQAA